MSDEIKSEKSLEEMNRCELRMYREKLKSEGKSYCSGELCHGKIKPLDEFPKYGLAKCIQCYNHYSKAYYTKYGKTYMREKIRLKLDKCCEECGCEDIELLEFDHLEPEDKNITIGSNASTKRIIKEAKQTRFLCIWCHRLRSYQQINDNVKKDRSDYEYSAEENEEEIDTKNSKPCTGELCKGKRRNLCKFYKSKNIYSFHCIRCMNYNNTVKRRKITKMINDIKLTISECTECNKEVTFETLCCFDFDHLDQSTKTYNVSSFASKNIWDMKNIQDEINKCQLLCCNCHKKKTIKQLNYRKIDKELLDKFEPVLLEKPEKIPSICLSCNKNEKGINAQVCDDCAHIKQRKVVRPSFEQLEDEIAELGYKAIGRKYNVGENTIRKWIRWYVKKEGKTVTKIKIKL